MRNPFQGLSGGFTGAHNRAAQDISHNFSTSSSKHNNGLVMATLKALDALGLMRFPLPVRARKFFSRAATPKPEPRPGKDSGF